MTATHRQRAPWLWRLAPAAATRIRAANLPRWLVVTEGRVWLTESRRETPGDDVWLAAGDGHCLPAGSEWVAEGWPRATVEMVEAPPR